MIEIIHQFSNEDFYIPKWNVKHLFVGTFNPSGGEKVNYYYGRSKNRTWEILSNISGEKLNTKDDDFLIKLQKNGIACIDLIHSVSAPIQNINGIIGQGYSDSKIINKRVNRIYNTNEIKNLIRKNPGIKVYSTWGNGSNLKNWKEEVKKIENLINLKSPSMAARVPKGFQKFDFMLNNWREKINI